MSSNLNPNVDDEIRIQVPAENIPAEDVFKAFDAIPLRSRMALLGLAPIRVDDTKLEEECQIMLDMGMFRKEDRQEGGKWLVRTVLADSFIQEVAENAAAKQRSEYGIPSDEERKAEFDKAHALDERRTVALESIAAALVGLLTAAKENLSKENT